MQLCLAEYGPVFSTRNRGERLRDELLEKIEDLSTVELVFDFANVMSASYSFVDELVGEMVERMVPNTPSIINASPSIVETIERSLRNRRLDGERIFVSSLEYA
jgi:hypothetical protein